MWTSVKWSVKTWLDLHTNITLNKYSAEAHILIVCVCDWQLVLTVVMKLCCINSMCTCTHKACSLRKAPSDVLLDTSRDNGCYVEGFFWSFSCNGGPITKYFKQRSICCSIPSSSNTILFHKNVNPLHRNMLGGRNDVIVVQWLCSIDFFLWFIFWVGLETCMCFVRSLWISYNCCRQNKRLKLCSAILNSAHISP